MRIKAKKFLFLVLSFNMIFFYSSCFNYRDINKIIFATAVILDYDEDTDMVIAYDETFRPFRGAEAGSEKGTRIIFKGTGKTFFEAIRDINLSSSYKVHYSQCKAIIFTERAATAKIGLKKFTDMIDRDQEFLLRPYVFIYYGDPERLLKMKLKEEEYIGFFLYNLVQNVGTASRSISVTVNEFLAWRLMGGKTYVLTGLRIKQDQIEDKIEIDGCGVFKNDKMVEAITRREMQGFNFLMDRVKTGTLEVTNPDNPDQFVTLEILNSDTKTKIRYENGKIKLIKNITTKVSIGEVQSGLIITRDNLSKIKKNAEDNIEKYSTRIFNDYKYKGVDIFEVEQELYRHYPKVKMEEPIKESNLEIKVEVKIEGSSNKTNNLQ
jgi:spore germination protein KC